MAATRSKALAAELSRMVDTSHWHGPALSIVVETTVDERRRLAARFDLQDIVSLRGELCLEQDDDDLFRLSGRLVADVVQTCVVSLEPIRAHVDESFGRSYSAAAKADATDEPIDAEGDDPPDPIVEGKIDVGEALAEELGLALDPYPRLPGASLKMATPGDTPRGPFDRLRDLQAPPAGATNAPPSPAAGRRQTRS